MNFELKFSNRILCGRELSSLIEIEHYWRAVIANFNQRNEHDFKRAWESIQINLPCPQLIVIDWLLKVEKSIGWLLATLS